MIAVSSKVDITPLDRRRRARQRTRQSGMILDGDLQIECTIVDQSETGARLAVKGELPERFHVLRLKTGECHEARLVWRDAKHAGVAYAAAFALSEPSENPRHKRLRLIWQRLNKR